jgi:hypothetical protein
VKIIQDATQGASLEQGYGKKQARVAKSHVSALLMKM